MTKVRPRTQLIVYIKTWYKKLTLLRIKRKVIQLQIKNTITLYKVSHRQYKLIKKDHEKQVSKIHSRKNVIKELDKQKSNLNAFHLKFSISLRMIFRFIKSGHNVIKDSINKNSTSKISDRQTLKYNFILYLECRNKKRVVKSIALALRK